MIEQDCDNYGNDNDKCKKELRIAEKEEEVDKGMEFYAIQFSYRTFFFCSEKCKDEYAS